MTEVVEERMDDLVMQTTLMPLSEETWGEEKGERWVE